MRIRIHNTGRNSRPPLDRWAAQRNKVVEGCLPDKIAFHWTSVRRPAAEMGPLTPPGRMGEKQGRSPSSVTAANTASTLIRLNVGHDIPNTKDFYTDRLRRPGVALQRTRTHYFIKNTENEAKFVSGSTEPRSRAATVTSGPKWRWWDDNKRSLSGSLKPLLGHPFG